MAELSPTTLTFLFTDLAGSTRLWEHEPQAAAVALARHDALIEHLVAEHGGQLVRPRGEGDSRFAVFARATAAVRAAGAIQQALHAEAWPTTEPLRVRIALYTGEAEARAGDYYGAVVNRRARLRAAAAGGQTLLARATYELIRDAVKHGAVPDVSLRDLGTHRLRDVREPEYNFELVVDGLPSEFPPLRTLEAEQHALPSSVVPVPRIEPVNARAPALLPAGTLTFVYTDFERSKRAFQQFGLSYVVVLTQYLQALQGMFAVHGRQELDIQGDAVLFAFPRARAAVAAAVAAQWVLAPNSWPTGMPLSARMALHTGEPPYSSEGYGGLDVMRASRLDAHTNAIKPALAPVATMGLLPGSHP